MYKCHRRGLLPFGVDDVLLRASLLTRSGGLRGACIYCYMWWVGWVWYA